MEVSDIFNSSNEVFKDLTDGYLLPGGAKHVHHFIK